MSPLQTLVIPPRLDEKLGARTELAAAVRLTLATFAPWIGDSTQGLFFFPEYTDHGATHINRVLDAAVSLATRAAWEQLTQEDAAVLTLAVLLHDAAMHLSADGLLVLLGGSAGAPAGHLRPRVEALDTGTWPELFDEYLFEARRWDSRTLHRILGDRAQKPETEGDLAGVPRHVREQPNPETWTLQYRKFLGEFVRRHHARLAHEIARWGVPAPGPQPPAAPHRLSLALPENLAEYADLAGLVARSHNLPLRATFPYLAAEFNGRVHCRGAHPVFLMVLLRIADFLELDASRANPAQLLVSRLRSPISQDEWDAHLAIVDIRQDESDQEAVFVAAKPKSAAAFFKLRRLLSGLQQELDLSWAVLGEVFSRQGELASLGLRLRRVRSNLDDPAEFERQKQPPYFPVEAGFATAGAALLQLLIRPLYGDRPEIGVRELLQNALDAVQELRSYMSRRGDPELRTVQLAEQDADVLISIDDDSEGRHWLTITDKGIGMTADVINGYFLKAGASFRQSDAWRREFEDAGRPRVLRSGRFGVGAFAAFLLGSRIEVHTRHVTTASEQDAIYFSAALVDEQLELVRRPKLSIGTTIRIEMPRRLDRDQRPWDWYTLGDPRVERRSDGRRLPQRFDLPERHVGPIRDDWRRIQSDGFEAIDWTFSAAPALTCNGLRVTEGVRELSDKFRISWPDDEFIPWPVPNVSAFDRQGNLPLTLQRDDLEERHYPFSADLLRDVTLEMIAFLLVHLPETPWLPGGFGIGDLLAASLLTGSTLLFTQSGFLLRHPTHLAASHTRNALVVALPRPAHLAMRPPVEATILDQFPSPLLISTADLLISRLTSLFFESLVGIRLLTFGYPARQASRVKTVFNDGYTAIREWGSVGGDPGRLGHLRAQLPADVSLQGGFVAELYIAPEELPIVPSPFSEIWQDLVGGDLTIPFDRRERERKLPRAMRQLADRIAAWRRLDQPGWRGALVEWAAYLESEKRPLAGAAPSAAPEG